MNATLLEYCCRAGRETIRPPPAIPRVIAADLDIGEPDDSLQAADLKVARKVLILGTLAGGLGPQRATLAARLRPAE